MSCFKYVTYLKLCPVWSEQCAEYSKLKYSVHKNVPPVILFWYHKGIMTHALKQKQDFTIAGWGEAHFEYFFFFSRRFISIMDPWSDCAVYSVNIVRHAATITQSTMWHPDCDCCVQPQSDYEWITLKEFTEKGTHLHTWEQTHLCSSRQKVTLLFHTKEWEIWLNNIIASIWNEWMNIIAFDSNENYTHKCECMLSVQKASLSCFAP